MVYLLTRSGASPADEPRLREIHTPDEVVHPTWEDGTWTAKCRTGSASNALQGRRYGFALVEEKVEADDLRVPVREPPARVAGAPAFAHRTQGAVRAVVEDLGFRVHDGEPLSLPDGPRRDWERWRDRKRERITSIDSGNLHQRLRARVDPELLERAAEIARSGAWDEPEGEEVAIVKVFHGWSAREQEAASSALDSAVALGPRSRVVLVQNDASAHAATRAWKPRANGDRLSVVTVRNDGFAAACNAGAKRAGKAPWLLFTQADALWGPGSVRDALGLSRALREAPTGFGAPAVIGPSGGYVEDFYNGAIREWGRNVRHHRGLPPEPVDWLAGYWLLVDGATFRKVGGWAEDFFLYFEDPDLSLRLAMAGARPFAWPGLAVEHERGGTIRTRVEDAIVSQIQGESRQTFGARWGGR